MKLLEINNNKSDIYKRDYFASNKKIKKSSKANFTIKNGITELIKTNKSQNFKIVNVI